MSLRPDSVYRVDLAEPPSSGSRNEDDRHSPPKVLQIRLTEQALQQLANAYAGSGAERAQIRLDMESAEPLLVVGRTTLPLHSSLPASASQPRAPAAAPTAASSSTAPHELYRLSHDESTLTRVGTIAAKLSVKPTRDVSAVAQRLKQQKEEEELRKEQRRQALMQGASPNLSSSSSASRSSTNKNLAAARASTSSPFFSSSPLSRSSSLSNVAATRRQTGLLPSAALSRAQSREVSPGAARPNPSATSHPKVQAASYEAGPSARRTDRAITDSPQTSSSAQVRMSSAFAHASEHKASRLNGSNLSMEEEAHVSDDSQPRRADFASSPASTASDPAAGATKKSSKLTTRQRLAKATKAGSRLLAVSERKPPPERRSTPNATAAAPVPSSARSSTQSINRNSTPGPVDLANSPVARTEAIQRASKLKQTSVSAPAQNPKTEAQTGTVPVRSRGTATSDKSSDAMPSRSKAEVPDKATANSKHAGLSDSPQQAVKRERTVSVEQRATSSKADRTAAATSTGQTGLASRAHEKAAPPAVPVVTMRRARPSTADDGARAKAATQSSSPSKTVPRTSESEAPKRETPARVASASRPHVENDVGAAGSSSSPPSKLANLKKRSDELPDAGQRKRRRTNDFAPSSDQPIRYRERRLSASPEPVSRRADGDMSERRDESAARSVRPTETSRAEGSVRESIPPSASMPSFASAGHRLRSVPEAAERESRHSKPDERRDRPRDSRDHERRHEDDRARDRSKSSHRTAEEGSRGRRGAPDGQGSSSRGVSNGSYAVKSPSGSSERPIKGVGPGATHWSEPWLDVRSRADWHRLAQRFAKTQQEYLASRKRLEAESKRLDRELELASAEEQAASQPGAHSQGAASRSLLFSPHARMVRETVGHAATGGDAELDVDMLDIEKQTFPARAAPELARSRQSNGAKRKQPAQDGDDSPEEGEMSSSDDEGQAGPNASGRSEQSVDRGSGVAASQVEMVRDASRSASPDNIAWRPHSSVAVDAETAPSEVVRPRTEAASERPLSYTELANRVQQLAELHGSLSRMHRVLVDFKAKGLMDSIA